MKKHPILIIVPHCSENIPPAIRRQILLSDFQLRHKTDPYTDKIFHVKKAYCLKASYSRAVIDFNRAPDDFILDKKGLCEDGVLVTVPFRNKPLYKKPPDIGEVNNRIKKYYIPFHKKIKALLPKIKFIIDCHSLYSVDEKTKKKRADIAIGNGRFLTCSRDLTLAIAKFFESKGFSVAINEPFDGGYIIKHYCAIDKIQGVMIEIKRSLYMNERTLRPYSNKIKKLNYIMVELVEMINQIIYFKNFS